MTEVWYRIDDVSFATFSFYGDYNGSYVKNMYRRFPVLKHTEKGVWLDLGSGEKRFVLKDARKKFACPTIEEAKISFIARKTKQLRILRNQIKHVEDALNLL